MSEADLLSPGPRWPVVVVVALSLALSAMAFDGGAPTEAQDNGELDDAEVPSQPQSAISELESSGTYASAQFGHSVSWDPSRWSVLEAISEPSHDHLVLESDVSAIELDAFGDSDGGAPRCLVDQVYADLDEVSGFDAVADDVLPPTADGGLPSDAGLYLITLGDQDGEAETMIRYVECRTLITGGAVLRIVITAPEPSWASDLGPTGAVLAAIELPVWWPDFDRAAPPTSGPSPSPDEEAEDVEVQTA